MKNEIVIVDVWNVAMNSRLNLRKKAIPINPEREGKSLVSNKIKKWAKVLFS
jgi:hypothetical protein